MSVPLSIKYFLPVSHVAAYLQQSAAMGGRVPRKSVITFDKVRAEVHAACYQVGQEVIKLSAGWKVAASEGP